MVILQIYANGNYDKLTKYCTDTDNEFGKVDNKKTLDPEDDAAVQNWGNGWRMPTVEEYKELVANCDWKWTEKDGVNGCEFTSKKNGNKIFFPAAGAMWPTFSRAGFDGYYWSSSLSGNHICAQLLGCDSVGAELFACTARSGGLSVRAVRSKNEPKNEPKNNTPMSSPLTFKKILTHR